MNGEKEKGYIPPEEVVEAVKEESEQTGQPKIENPKDINALEFELKRNRATQSNLETYKTLKAANQKLINEDLEKLKNEEKDLLEKLGIDTQSIDSEIEEKKE